MNKSPTRHSESSGHGRYDVYLHAGRKDFEALSSVVTSKTKFLQENHSDDLSKVVMKPWGHESRVYADFIHDLWHLCITDGNCTSMHAHIRKTTKLLCLEGEGMFETFEGTFAVSPGTILTIGPGAFHRTIATSKQLHLIEVETPRNKFDLVRLRDNYERTTNEYEKDVTSFGESDLKPTRKMPGAYLRQRSTHDKYRFDLKTGMDLFYTKSEDDIFYVPIGIESFVLEHPVLAARFAQHSEIQKQARYCVISSK